jgi:hypothetical protein
MINTFQFLSKYMNINTLVKLYSITNEIYLKELIIKKIGFYPISLNSLKDKHLINFKNLLSIYKNGENLHLYNGEEVIHCFLKKDELLKLTVYFLELKDINIFKIMMKNFKKIFEEFYLSTCDINHSSDLIVRLKIKKNIYIDIPPYFHCILVQNSNFIKIK